MSLSRTLYSVFFEGCQAYATGYLNGKGEASYTTVEEIPTLELIDKHQIGEISLGAYTVLLGNEVRYLAWDIDSKKYGLPKARELAKKLSDYLTEHGIPHGIEFSGSKGYHIYVFFKKRVSAATVKLIGERIRDILGLQKNGDPHVEVYPKQGELTKSNPFGNLLRVPLGAHPKTKKITFFVDTVRWEEGEPFDPEQIFSQKVDLEDLEKIISEADPFEQIVNLLAPYWESGQRHNISLNLCGLLAQSGWTEESVSELIREVHSQNPEGDLNDQLKTVKSTFKRFYASEKIVGFTGLSEILPTATLKQLMDLIGKGSSSTILQVVDNERMGKGAGFLKVRNVARLSVSYLKEHGRLVRDENDVYWLNRETHQLIMMGTLAWERLLHNLFGLNLSESFGRQVAESLKHFCFAEAKEVKIQKRSFWDGRLLYVNLGGPEIYILCGDPRERRIVFNGEIDIFFKNFEDTLRVPNLETVEDPAISAWKYLADDVNFKAGDATAIQQREMLKAYICGIFFPQIFPVRPILAILAASGSGKTTTARRILQVLEGLNADVLSVNEDKPDSFRASIAIHKLLVLDNLEESNARWLVDALNRISTGTHIELRELHTTNRMKKIIPDCFVTITATKLPFSNETVYSRFLPIELDVLTEFRPENLVKADLANNYNAIWKGILDDLDKVVAELNRVKEVEVPITNRLADFMVFCHRIKGVDFLDGKELLSGLGNLVNRQKEVLEKNSTFIEALQVWIRTRGDAEPKWMDISELFSVIQKVALLNRIEWKWSSSQGLSKHVGVLESQLIKNFGLIVRSNKEGGRERRLYKFEKRILEM